MVGPESPGALKETVTPDAATRSSRVSTHFVIAAAIVLGAAAVRVPGLFSDFWLDEIWSLDNALAAASWTDIFRIRFDNNHHLNSLYLWLIGDGAPLPVYRLPAFAAGIASVVAAWALAAREGRFPAIVTCVTFSLSYLLVYYSSEARGYALVVLFSLAGWLVVQRHAERPSKGHTLVLAACAVLGVMAHRTFVLFLVGAYVWFDVHDTNVVQGFGNNGFIVTLFFDKQSGLLRRMIRYANSAVGHVPTQIDYDDYRPVAGVMMP